MLLLYCGTLSLDNFQSAEYMPSPTPVEGERVRGEAPSSLLEGLLSLPLSMEEWGPAHNVYGISNMRRVRRGGLYYPNPMNMCVGGSGQLLCLYYRLHRTHWIIHLILWQCRLIYKLCNTGHIWLWSKVADSTIVCGVFYMCYILYIFKSWLT